MTEDFIPFLQVGPSVQSDDDAVVGFSRRAISTETQAVAQAVRLYYAVRDEIRYDGYDLDISVDGLYARRNLELGHGWCISKRFFWQPVVSRQVSPPVWVPPM